MKVKLLEREEKSVRFEIKGTTPVFANALRRTMLNRVNVMAADFIEVQKNNSTLYNEAIAHRIGMIPMAFAPGDYNVSGECTCKGAGCSKCQVKFVLRKRGPGNVYAGDIKSTDESVQPLDKSLLITKLAVDEEIDIEFTARLGTGSNHARWQSSVVGYQYYPVLKVKNECDLCGVCIKKCSKKLLSEVKGGKKIELGEPYKCDLCRSCMASCPKMAMAIDGDPSHIIMTVESVSGLAPKDIVLSAAESLAGNLKDIKEQAKSL